MNIFKPHKHLTASVLCLAIFLMVIAQTPVQAVQANNSLAPAMQQAKVMIYDNSLASGWQDWSWDATRKLNNSSPTQSGSASISVTLTKAWGALYLHRSSALSTTGYTHLEFYVHGGTSGSQKLKVVANVNTSKEYPFTTRANAWTKVSIPLANLGSPASLLDLYFQDAAGKTQPVFYLDAVSLINLASPTATAIKTSTPTKVSTATEVKTATTQPNITATFVPTSTFLPVITKTATPFPTQPAPTQPTPAGTAIYADQLAAGWQNWSWNTSSKLDNTSPVQSGSQSIAVTYTSGWAALYLHHNGLSTSGMNALRFWVHGGNSGGQKVRFIVNQNTANTVNLTLTANTWTQVDVSLASVGSPASIIDLWWQDPTGGAQPIFYIDQISLISSSTIPQPTAQPTSVSPTPGSTTRFNTLPPGSALPSDAQCASLVKRRAENKGTNAVPNATKGNQRLASDFFSGGDPRANTEIAVRVTGNFTGTTDEILQWVACKWGIDEDVVRAQAAQESWWRQSTKGDWTTDSSRCAPGHGIGVDGQPGQCPESFGILQNRYPYEQSAWPGIIDSTAFNADTAYAHWRSCYEGYETWLNHVERGWDYGAGDQWGCVGRWFAGRWHTQPAEEYISKVKNYLNTRVWETAGFQEP